MKANLNYKLHKFEQVTQIWTSYTIRSTTIIYVKQVIWGGWWQDGSACSTDEEVEQINSHMSRYGNTTKYMLPGSYQGFNVTYTMQIISQNTVHILYPSQDAHLSFCANKNHVNIQLIGGLGWWLC